MNKVPDRAKMRREYVWKRTKSETIGLVAAGVATASVALAVHHLFTFGVTIPGVVVIGIMLYVGARIWKYSTIQADSIPYVPPVSAQIPSLPAEEVLLRGSDASAVLTEDLLRPVVTLLTPEAELLRPTAQQIDELHSGRQ